jgi:hypothetical protein
MYGAPGSEFDDIIRGMGRSLMIGKQTMQHESPSITQVDGFQNVLVGWKQFFALSPETVLRVSS